MKIAIHLVLSPGIIKPNGLKKGTQLQVKTAIGSYSPTRASNLLVAKGVPLRHLLPRSAAHDHHPVGSHDLLRQLSRRHLDRHHRVELLQLADNTAENNQGNTRLYARALRAVRSVNLAASCWLGGEASLPTNFSLSGDKIHLSGFVDFTAR